VPSRGLRRRLLRLVAMTPRYFRRVAADRWVVQGTAYALQALPEGTFQFFSSGRPVFTVASLLEADQALTDLLDTGGES
jgi:hypothetical protein